MDTKDAYVVIKLILMIVATEALVELWKKAAPLQGIREWLIRTTPLLYSERQQTHLLDCPYCISVWAGFSLTAMYLFMDTTAWLVITASLATHRLSNFLHLYFSLIRDRQLDLRVARRYKNITP